jgi:putative transcriptional regulator
LLGENVTEPEADDLQAISQKLEVINSQLAQRKEARRKAVHWLFISLTSMIVLIAAVLFYLNSPYLEWNYHDPETAVLGTAFHSFEWAFVRVGPFVLIGAIVGIVMTRRKDR